MKLLLANSNTSAEVTQAIRTAAQRVASSDTEIIARNANFGARVVGTRTEAAVAAHGLIDMLAEHGSGVDAVVIGMSFDTGLWAAREMLAVPVLGMTEAACFLASTLAPRFGLITLGARGAQPYRELMESYGLDRRLAGIRALPVTPQELLRDPAGFHDKLTDAASSLHTQDGAEAVVLVGAVMAGLPPVLQACVPVPLVEGISAAVVLAEALVRLTVAKPQAGSLQPVGAREVVGLSPALSTFFARAR